jgi:hypothetical protein
MWSHDGWFTRGQTVKKSRPSRRRAHIAIEDLEERWTPSSGATSITFNFNPTPIAAGSTVWFNSSLQASGLGSAPVTLQFTNQTIAFTAGASSYNLNVPTSIITFVPASTAATTTYSASANTWTTSVPSKLGGNVFLGGLALVVPNGLPGGIKNVTWQGQMQSDTAGVSVQWHGGAAVYKNFASDYTTLNVKPCDDGHASSYQNPDHAGTPEVFKTSVTAGATGGGGNNYTGNASPNTQLTPPVPPPVGITYISGNSSDYPFTSGNPLTSVAFNESDVLTAAALNTNNNTFEVWYTDEHALTLGVNQVTVIAANGTPTTTNYPVTALNGDPGYAANPAVGTTATPGDQAGTDPSGRPLAPSLYITDITNDPTSRSGDWQYGGTAIPPSAVFGTWKSYAKTVDYTQGGLVTLTGATDPAKNGLNLGSGADTPPPGVANEGYTAEVRWNLSDLGLLPGHNYRFYVMVHDGDQNKTGGDVGQASYQVNSPVPVPVGPPATLSGYVYDTSSGTPVGMQGIRVTLTGITTTGQSVTFVAITLADGSYSFPSLAPGTYAVAEDTTQLPSGYTTQAQAGTENPGLPTPDGTSNASSITDIALVGGDTAVNYDFFNNFFVPVG